MRGPRNWGAELLSLPAIKRGMLDDGGQIERLRAMSKNTTVSPEPSGGLHLPRVLIVDDDESHLQFIKMIIMKGSFACDLVLCSDPAWALDYVKSNRVDLVLLDVVMPDIDGFEVNSVLKGDPDTADIPVIFLTSSQETDIVVQAYESGAVDFIAKPINSAVLTARMQAVLQRIRLENELRLRNQELEELNRFKDEMISVCSHDLRAPLAAIDVICQGLTKYYGGEDHGEEKKQLDKIINQSRMARRLVENLLDYDKIEEGMLVLSPSFFQLREFLELCAEQEQPLIQARKYKFQVDLPEADVIGFGDRELLAQAVRNILGNAIKFAGTTISLSAEIKNMTRDLGGRLNITISDDGGGIDPEQMPNIFQKYSKADPHASGSGLGLYIARKAVELHGGTISVESSADTTVFTLDLPHVYRSSQFPDLSETSERRGLVVSSNKIKAQLMESILLEAGMLYVTSQVTNLADADFLQSPLPDFILVDLDKSSVNVFNLVKFINGHGVATQWIYFGSGAEVDTIAKLVNPPYSHLPSPLNPLGLLNLMDKILSGKEAGGTTLSG